MSSNWSKKSYLQIILLKIIYNVYINQPLHMSWMWHKVNF